MGRVKDLFIDMKERGLTLTLKEYLEMKRNENKNKDNEWRNDG